MSIFIIILILTKEMGRINFCNNNQLFNFEFHCNNIRYLKLKIFIALIRSVSIIHIVHIQKKVKTMSQVIRYSKRTRDFGRIVLGSTRTISFNCVFV